MKKISDLESERAILSGLIKYGSTAYHNISDIGLSDASFVLDSNREIYKCLEYIFKNHENIIPDIPLIYSAAGDLGLKYWFKREQEVEYLDAVINFLVKEENIRVFAKKIKKLEMGRRIYEKLEQAQTEISDITGDEPVSDIFGIIENNIIDCTKFLSTDDTKTSQIGDGIDEHFKELEDNPIDNIGVSTGFPIYDNIIGGGLRNGGLNVIGARAKCLEENSLVYTPNGPIKIKDIKIGDKICHPDGTLSNVLNIINAGIKDKYKIEFKDGDIVYCDEDHIWSVNCSYGKYETILKTTKELFKSNLTVGKKQNYRWQIQLPKPLQFNEQKLPLDPYILGLLLGDGSFRNAINYYTADEELLNAFNKLPADFSIKLEKDYGKCKAYRINGLQNIIRKIGLYKKTSKNKFIPDIYKYNSIENRLAILQGLMDTDGTCTFNSNKTTKSVFSSISFKLISDVKEIVESLGGICKITEHYQKYNNKLHLSYRCVIILDNFNPFRLKRKSEKFISKPRYTKIKRVIKNITLEKEKSNMICLSSDRADGLFLTNNCIITHNCGKSTFALNIALHIAKLGIPVLYLDTEMGKIDSWNRMTAALSEIHINEIETGKYSKFTSNKHKVRKALDYIKQLPLYYESIAGSSLETQVASVKRWLITKVGLNKDGTAKKCVIIYDYLKIMDDTSIKTMAEHQAVGFLVSSLVNFSIKYNFPILAFVQLNRDGISKEDTSAISLSDRILWFCSSMSIIKWKSDEERKADGYENGNLKMLSLACRYGSSLAPLDYICFNFNGAIAKVSEGKTHFEIFKEKKKKIEAPTETTNDTDEGTIPF